MSVQNNTCYCFIKGINGLVEYSSCCNMNTKHKLNKTKDCDFFHLPIRNIK